jgi:hypothetical protein
MSSEKLDEAMRAMKRQEGGVIRTGRRGTRISPISFYGLRQNPEGEWRSQNSGQSSANRGKPLERTKPQESCGNETFRRSKDNLGEEGKVVESAAGHTLKENESPREDVKGNGQPFFSSQVALRCELHASPHTLGALGWSRGRAGNGKA